MTLTILRQSLPSARITSTLSQPTTTFIRNTTSARRTTKRLRLRPDDSFLPLPSIKTGSHSPFPLSTSSREEQLNSSPASLIYNPPPSLPSVYDTPSLFLPSKDPRKSLFRPAPIAASSTPAQDLSSSAPLPPPVRPTKEKKYHLTPEDINKIRELRTADPVANSRSILADKYKASKFFIGMIAEAPEEHKQKQLDELEKVKLRWGKKRRDAKEDAARRRQGWGRDEAM
ncbi:mitochondrial ribosomal protein subunit L20-domain-containing protein [Peziza echinospora]|nr:mitochondrial ribosomal protein subunit L20-domain-containing protein [Peziza echinospora]